MPCASIGRLFVNYRHHLDSHHLAPNNGCFPLDNGFTVMVNHFPAHLQFRLPAARFGRIPSDHDVKAHLLSLTGWLRRRHITDTFIANIYRREASRWWHFKSEFSSDRTDRLLWLAAVGGCCCYHHWWS